MKVFIAALIYIYSNLLLLYPRRFRDEFGEEMQVVFRDSVDAAGKDGILSLVIVSMRELVSLPGSVLREFLHEGRGKEVNMIGSEKTPPVTINEHYSHWDALIAALPFLLFGIANMIIEIVRASPDTYSYLVDAHIYLAFYVIMLAGLFLGLIKGVPRWTYSYLGWSLTLAWLPLWRTAIWWTPGNAQGMSFDGWQTWIPLLVTFLAALILRRSLTPLFILVKRVWEDWTLLSLAIYTFVGFLMLDYDENHSPYLIAFMFASTLAVSISVWFFMKSIRTQNRAIALVSGFVTLLIIGRISESTWDIAAYYGLPQSSPMPWYDSILGMIVITGLWGGILLWPALFRLVQRALPAE